MNLAELSSSHWKPSLKKEKKKLQRIERSYITVKRLRQCMVKENGRKLPRKKKKRKKGTKEKKYKAKGKCSFESFEEHEGGEG